MGSHYLYANQPCCFFKNTIYNFSIWRDGKKGNVLAENGSVEKRGIDSGEIQDVNVLNELDVHRKRDRCVLKIE